MCVSTLEPGERCGVGARIAPPLMEATDASRLVCVVVVSYQEYSLRGELIPFSNQLSGAVGGRASGALISIVNTRRRCARSSAGGTSSTGAGSRRSQCRGDASGCLRRAACCSRRWRKTRLAAHQGHMLWRDVRRMRPGGEGACVTTLLEMRFGAQR